MRESRTSLRLGAGLPLGSSTSSHPCLLAPRVLENGWYYGFSFSEGDIAAAVHSGSVFCKLSVHQIQIQCRTDSVFGPDVSLWGFIYMLAAEMAGPVT